MIRTGAAIAIVTQLTHDRDATMSGKHAIDRDHGIVAGDATAQRLIASGGKIHLVAAGRERIHQLTGVSGFVFNDQKYGGDLTVMVSVSEGLVRKAEFVRIRQKNDARVSKGRVKRPARERGSPPTRPYPASRYMCGATVADDRPTREPRRTAMGLVTTTHGRASLQQLADSR